MAEILIGLRGLDGILRIARADLPAAAAIAMARSATLRIHVANNWPQLVEHETGTKVPLTKGDGLTAVLTQVQNAEQMKSTS